MNQQVTGIIAGVSALLVMAWVGFEIRRRKTKLRELYDVLNAEDRVLTGALEAMVKSGELKSL